MEYRVLSKTGRAERPTVTLIVSIVLLFLNFCAILIASTYTGLVATMTVLEWTELLWLAASVLAGYWLVLSKGLEKARLSLVFVLGDNELVRRRPGWPETRIGLSEIKSACEGSGWLTIEGREPYQRVMVPTEIEGYVQFRERIEQHCPVTICNPRIPWVLISVIPSLLCWILVLCSDSAVIMKLAVGGGLASLGWQTFRVCRQTLHNPKRFLFWVATGLSWGAALVILYVRMVCHGAPS